MGWVARPSSPCFTHYPKNKKQKTKNKKAGGKGKGKSSVLRLCVLDTNVTLEQLDFLENEEVSAFSAWVCD
jgi:hypothetical protein